MSHSLVIFLFYLYSSHCTITIIEKDSVVRRMYELSYSTTKEPPPYIKGTIHFASDECFNVQPPSNWTYLEHNYAFILFERSPRCTMQAQFITALSAGYQVVVFTEPSVQPRFSRPSEYNDLAIVLLLTENDFNTLINYEYSITGSIAVYHPNPIPYVYHILPLIMVGSGVILIFLSLSGYYGYRILYKKYQQYKISRRILYLPTRRSVLIDEDEQCPICWENYKVGDVMTVLFCKHEYHRECLRKWIGDECPLCRSKIYGKEHSNPTPVTIRRNTIDEQSDDEEANLLSRSEEIVHSNSQERIDETSINVADIT